MSLPCNTLEEMVLMYNLQGIPEYRRVPREWTQCWRYVLNGLEYGVYDAAGLYLGQHTGVRLTLAA